MQLSCLNILKKLNEENSIRKLSAYLPLLFCLVDVATNTLVKLDEDVKTKWNQVETQYQRRSDLIPNLVSTVKGAAKFGAKHLNCGLLKHVSKASQIKVDPDKLTAENIDKFQNAQGTDRSGFKPPNGSY